ncbi:MAG: 50S ribosomal protein L1 [Candidatus Aenigmarchaeota archaeon]|nr:50S ribosomal protein L1 [Candidatus Aenigmarchaeota archaeon]
MEREKIIEAIKKARDGKERKFKQTLDLVINLKGLDLKKPENRIKAEIFLPKGIGKKPKIGIFADSLIPAVNKLEDADVILIRKDKIEDYSRDKKAGKKMASECHAFLAEAPLMPMVGKSLGQVLAPRNKMPKPIPPTIPNLKPVVERTRNTVRINLKDSPVIYCGVGKEDMGDEILAENIEAVLKAVETGLPRGKEQIREIIVKLTMGKPVKIE